MVNPSRSSSDERKLLPLGASPSSGTVVELPDSPTSGTLLLRRPPDGDTFEPELPGLSNRQLGAELSRYSSVSLSTLTTIVDSTQHPVGGHSKTLSYPLYQRSANTSSSGHRTGPPKPSPDASSSIDHRLSELPVLMHRSPSSQSSLYQYDKEDVSNRQAVNLLWTENNVEDDDYLHNPDLEEGPGFKIKAEGRVAFTPYSPRGMANSLGMFIVLGGLVALFMFWPIIYHLKQQSHHVHRFGWNIGGTNATGQVPDIPGLPNLIDVDTPKDVYQKTGHDGKKYELVFSDEFNQDGRTFWPGDDPFWEAVDLNYWGTHNYEWCDPDAITTKDGNLEITMTEEPIHGLNFRSGFLQSWNKFCFSKNARVEVNLSLPGDARASGFWPGVWTMGNLGRGGYGASNDGTWPYSYDSCDVGTQPNQTNVDGITPTAAKTSGSKDYGGELSWLPGQRLSACTCKADKDMHPGPSTSVGRGAPEIDILEAQVDYHHYGTASQSVQIAPFDAGWQWDNSSAGRTFVNPTTIQNLFIGSITQESVSGVTKLDNVSYNGAKYQTFGYELSAGRDDGYISWFVGDGTSWTLHAPALAPNNETQVGQRLISEEPMYMLINLFISSKFQGNPDFGQLVFPATFRIDYVRVYQPKGHTNIGCDPDDHPTADYINKYLPAYTNPNFTTWEEAGFAWPRNSRESGGCSTERAGP